jgi:hypothetical protein
MARTKPAGLNPFTVVCQWHPGVDACDPWQTVVVALTVSGDAEDAANEACLFLLWKRMGQATASLVMAGHPKLHVPDDALFDAEEYDDAVTFGAHIVAYRDLS